MSKIIERAAENLVGAGFTEMEATIIFLMYKSGLVTARELCQQTGIAKVSVLFILNKLYEEGIIERMRRDNTFVFSTRSPEALTQRLEAAGREVEKRKVRLNSAIMELQSLQDYEANRKIQYYDDPEHIRRLRAGLMDSKNSGGMIKRDTKDGVEYYENEEFIYLVSLKQKLAIKVTPKGDFYKLTQLCKSYS